MILKILTSLFWIGFCLSIEAQTESKLFKEAKKSFAKKSYVQATKQFLEYSEANPNDGMGYVYLGYIHEYKKEIPKSIQYFRRAVELSLPEDQRVNSLLKLTLFFNYKREWELTSQYANRLLRYRPDNSEIIKIRDNADELKRNPDANSYSSTKPKEKIEVNNSEDDPQWEEALELFESKQFEKSHILLSSLVEKKPLEPNYSYKLGLVKLRLNRYQEAIDVFQKTVPKQKTDNPDFFYYLYLNLAIAQEKLDKYQDSIESLKKSIQYRSKGPSHLLLAKNHFALGDYNSCLEDLKVAKTLGSASNDLKSICKLMLEQNTSSDTALLSIEKYIEKEFKNQPIPEKFFNPILKLARYYTNLEQFKKADQYFEVVTKTKSNDIEFLFYKGKSLYYQEKFSDSVQYLIKIQNQPAADYLLAKNYSMLGDINKSKEILKKLDPTFYEFAKQDPAFQSWRGLPEWNQTQTERTTAKASL